MQPVTYDPEPGETLIVAPSFRNGSPLFLGSFALSTVIESAWHYYGAAVKLTSGIDPQSADPHVATCSESASEGWDLFYNAVSGAMFHEHMHQFIGASGVRGSEGLHCLGDELPIAASLLAEAAYLTVRDPEGTLVRSALVILIVMLLIVLIGSVAIVLPATFAVNRLQNHIMERLLGMPPQVLSVRRVSFGARSAALTLARSCCVRRRCQFSRSRTPSS